MSRAARLSSAPSCPPHGAQSGFSFSIRHARGLNWAGWLLCMAMVLLLGACASRSPSPGRDGAPADAPPDLAALPDPEPRVEPIRVGGPNKPYTVLGQSYQPMTRDVSWKETGIASWYGTKFHGRKTASGEMFSMYGLTAAHRTLPIPSYARVRHAKTGKEIIVRVNDRGPFHGNRVIDLSYAAAVKLGMVGTGSAPVEVERLTFDDIRTGAWKKGTVMDPDAEAVAVLPLSPESGGVGANERADVLPTAPEGGVTTASAVNTAAAETAPAGKLMTARAHTPAAKGFWVQLAALSKRDSVDQLHQKVAAAMADLSPMLAVFREASFYKLQLGPYATRHEAANAAAQARSVLQLSPMVLERR